MAKKCIFGASGQANVIKLLMQMGAFEFEATGEENAFSPASPTSSTEAHGSSSSMSEIHYTSSSEAESVSLLENHDDEEEINILRGPFSPITPTPIENVMANADILTSESEIAPLAPIVCNEADLEELGGGSYYQL